MEEAVEVLHALVVARVEADLLQLATGDLPLFRLVGVELGQRGGRRGDARRLQHGLVVVQRPGVHAHRQRFQRSVVLAALQGDRVQPLLQAGVGAGQVRGHRLDRAVRGVLAEHRVPLGEDVRRVAGRDLGQQLRVPGRTRDAGLGDVDLRMSGVELVHHLAEQREGVTRPHGLPGEVHYSPRGRTAARRRGRAAAGGEDQGRARGEQRGGCRRSASCPGASCPRAPDGTFAPAARPVYLLNHEMLLCYGVHRVPAARVPTTRAADLAAPRFRG